MTYKYIRGKKYKRSVVGATKEQAMAHAKQLRKQGHNACTKKVSRGHWDVYYK